MTSFHLIDADDAALAPSADVGVALAQVRSAAVGAFDLEQARILDLVEDHDDIAERTCRPGHLTGSGLVVHAETRAVLLLFHSKLQRWLQPGGHADGDMNLAHVAWREATEETGIAGLKIVVPAIDLDIHRVDPPAEDAHLHLDVRYLIVAPADAVVVGNHESEELRWVTQRELGDFDLDPGTLRMAERGFAALDQL